MWRVSKSKYVGRGQVDNSGSTIALAVGAGAAARTTDALQVLISSIQ
jgi:hypothetical protein